MITNASGVYDRFANVFDTPPPTITPTPTTADVLNQLVALANLLPTLPDTPTTRDYLHDLHAALHAALRPYLTHGHRLTTTTTSSSSSSSSKEASCQTPPSPSS